MIEIDGRLGGGQLLRTTLACAAITQTAVELREIRGSRPDPGLRPQHISAIELLGEICGASSSEVAVGETTLRFEPGPIVPGTYDVEIGTAGSVMLLCDTVLPLATAIDRPLVVRARGGTDVKWAPTAGFHERVKFPVLRDHGLLGRIRVDRHGFYPVGGGEVTIQLAPSELSRFSAGRRAAIGDASVIACASDTLANSEVAERHASAAVDGLAERGISIERRCVDYVSAESPGSAIVVTLETDTAIAGFDAVGERGVPAENITFAALQQLDRFLETRGAVDDHLADQLLHFLAIAGGELCIPRRTDHVDTHLDVLESFGYEIDTEDLADAVRLTADNGMRG